MRRALPTAHRAADRLSALWGRWRNRPLAPESPFLWPGLLVFLWAYEDFYSRLILSPILWSAGYGGRYYELINASTGTGAAAWILSSCAWACFDIGLVVLALRLSGLSAEDIGWKRPHGSMASSLAAGALIGAAYMALKMYGWTPLVFFLKHGGAYPWARHFAPITDHHFFPGDPHALVYVLREPLFFFPLAEELVYRGFLYELFSRRFGRTLGALGSSFLFASHHFLSGDFARLFGVHLGDIGRRPMTSWGEIFVAGLLFCWLRDRRRSLAMPAAAHTAANFVADMIRVVVR